MASGSVQLYLYTSGRQPRQILARTSIMDSQQWRVYLVSPNWELSPTQYEFFGVIVDDVDLRVDYCHHTFSAAYIELIRKWQRVFRVIDGVRDFRIVQQKDAGTAAAKQTPTPSITRNRIRHGRHSLCRWGDLRGSLRSYGGATGANSVPCLGNELHNGGPAVRSSP